MKNFWIIGAIVFLYSCENSESEISAFSKKNVQKDEAVKVESYLSQGGKIKARLTTPKMLNVMADTPYVEFPKTLHVDFFNDQKTVENRLDSKYGKYFQSLNKIYLRDSVRLVRKQGDTLFCEDLWWDQNKAMFYTDRPALLKSPARFLDAKYGLEATQDFKEITFKTVENSRIITEGDALSAPPQQQQ